MSGRLRKVLLENLGLKLIALALALALFVMVRVEKESLAQGTVKLSVSAPAGKLLAANVPDQLRITVSGPASRMQRFRFEDLSDVHIDLSGVAEGYYKLGQDLVKLPSGFGVASLRPPGFQVRYEALTVRKLPVRVILQGQVAAGYLVTGRRSSPATVTVSGPKQAVMALKQVTTRPVSVEGAETTLVQQVDLTELPPKVSARPATGLEVSVEVAPLTSEVVLSTVPVVLERAAVAITVEPLVLEVTVSGPTQLLIKLNRVAVKAQVKAPAGLKGEAKLVPDIMGLPQGVKVVRVKPRSVTLTPTGAQP